MKKQKGFTLVELMVVMAIIAILATAGITQYSKFIKNGRDTARIADMEALNADIASYSVNSSTYPLTSATATPAEWVTAKGSFKLSKNYKDPVSGTSQCLDKDGKADQACKYEYASCDTGGGYIIRARMEASIANYSKSKRLGGTATEGYYEIGTCTTPSGFIEIQ